MQNRNSGHRNNLIRHLTLLLVVLFALSAAGCGGDEPRQSNPQTDNSTATTASSLLSELWQTSPITTLQSDRQKLFPAIQEAADNCSNTVFKSYLAADNTVAAALEKSYPILEAYNSSFDRVLNALKSDRPAQGEVFVYMLYNMGYVIKTADGAFAIDIFHRRAKELAPYIDFYAITHIHNDHKSIDLAQAMQNLGKPVLANFAIDGVAATYISDVQKDYEIGPFKIHSFITNHNNSATANVNVTVYKIDCGSNAGNCIIMHSGDSNFIASQYATVSDSKVDIYIPRYAPNALTENNVIGEVITPGYVLLSHILELTHADVSESRWSLDLGLQRANALNCSNSYMPFWGERMFWENGVLK
jgi:hypothetical protein